MVALMRRIRKDMNGAMLDSFACFGTPYGMNYGVAIHSLRDLAREQGEDDGFARFLYRQQVRELRLYALWTASSSMVDESDLKFWAQGIINSEVAEQASHALLSRISVQSGMLKEWIGASELLAYAALLSVSRSHAVCALEMAQAVSRAVEMYPESALVSRGASAILSSYIAVDRDIVGKTLETFPHSQTGEYIRDEVGWQLDY